MTFTVKMVAIYIVTSSRIKLMKLEISKTNTENVIYNLTLKLLREENIAEVVQIGKSRAHQIPSKAQ